VNKTDLIPPSVVCTRCCALAEFIFIIF